MIIKNILPYFISNQSFKERKKEKKRKTLNPSQWEKKTKKHNLFSPFDNFQTKNIGMGKKKKKTKTRQK